MRCEDFQSFLLTSWWLEKERKRKVEARLHENCAINQNVMTWTVIWVTRCFGLNSMEIQLHRPWGDSQLSVGLKPRRPLRDRPENLLDFWTIININYVRSEAIILAFDMVRRAILKIYSFAVVGDAKALKTSWSWVTDLSVFRKKLHSFECHRKLYQNQQHQRWLSVSTEN